MSGKCINIRCRQFSRKFSFFRFFFNSFFFFLQHYTGLKYVFYIKIKYSKKKPKKTPNFSQNIAYKEGAGLWVFSATFKNILVISWGTPVMKVLKIKAPQI